MISHSKECRARGAANSSQLKQSSNFQSLDEAEANTIAHAHSEVELLLESLGSDGWVQ